MFNAIDTVNSCLKLISYSPLSGSCKRIFLCEHGCVLLGWPSILYVCPQMPKRSTGLPTHQPEPGRPGAANADSLYQHSLRAHLYLFHRFPVTSEGSISSVQSPSHVRLFVSQWTAARQASLSITNSWSLLKLMSIELVMPSNHLIFCLPFLLLPSIFPASGSFPMSWLFASGRAKVLEFQLQYQSFQ